MEFAKIWFLTCHNWVKYWPRTKNNTTNREYSARAICWSFRDALRRFVWKRQGGGRTNPPPLQRRRWQNTVYGRGLRRGLRRIAETLHQMWRLDRHLAPPRRHSSLRLPETSRALHHSHRDLPNRGIWFHRPGDLQHARWMSKLVYV